MKAECPVTPRRGHPDPRLLPLGGEIPLLSLLQTMVGDRAAFGPWHGGSKLPRGGCTIPESAVGSVDPMEKQPKPQGGGSQLRHRVSLPHLSWQRRGKRSSFLKMFLRKRSWKSWKVKEEGKRGRTSSSSSQLGLQSFPSAATGCDVGLSLAAHFLFTSGGWRWSCRFLCTLALSHMVPNPVHPSWAVEGGC